MIEHNAGDCQVSISCGFECQQCVVDGAELISGDDDDGPSEFGGEVGDGQGVGQRAQQSSDSFDDQQIHLVIPPESPGGQQLLVDLLSLLPGCFGWREWCIEALRADSPVGKLVSDGLFQDIDIRPSSIVINATGGRFVGSDADAVPAKISSGHSGNASLSDCGVGPDKEQSVHDRFSAPIDRSVALA